MKPKVNLKQSKCFWINYLCLELTLSKIEQSLKDDILAILEESEELQPIGDLKSFQSTSKSIG